MHWLLALLWRPAEVRWILAMMMERFGLQALLWRFALLWFLAAMTKMRGLPSRRWRHEVWSPGAALALRKDALVPRGDDEDARSPGAALAPRVLVLVKAPPVGMGPPPPLSQATVKAPPPRFIGPRQAPLVPGVPVKALPSLSQAIVVPREPESWIGQLYRDIDQMQADIAVLEDQMAATNRLVRPLLFPPPAVSALPQPSDTRMFIWDDHELTDDGWAQLGIGATVRMCKGKGKGKDGKGKLLQLFAGEGYYTF